MCHGTYSSDDCANDIAVIKLDKPVAILPHTKYALRLRNHGARNNNGDGGHSTVKGSDGSTFTYTSCSLSFNGTNPTRGQIPQILYYSSPSEEPAITNSTANLAQTFSRQSALSITVAVVRNVSQLLGQAKEITDGRGQEVLYSAPMITTLLPHIIQIQQLGMRPPVPGGIQNLLQSHQQQKQQHQQQHQQKQVATPVSSGQFADSPQMHQQRAMQQQQLQQQQQQQRIMLQQQQLQLQLQQQRAMLQQQQQPQSQQQQKQQQQQQQQQQGVMLPDPLLLLHPLPLFSSHPTVSSNHFPTCQSMQLSGQSRKCLVTLDLQELVNPWKSAEQPLYGMLSKTVQSQSEGYDEWQETSRPSEHQGLCMAAIFCVYLVTLPLSISGNHSLVTLF